MPTNFSDQIIKFYSKLILKEQLPEKVEILNPYQKPDVMEIVKTFYTKYYADTYKRTMILGINPGRFGAGITGIPFTDPVQLETKCNITNSFDKKTELSSIFIYRLLKAYGSTNSFYKKFYISSVSPLGFIKEGKNINYYDIKSLQDTLSNFIVKNIKKQLKFGINREVCYCLGQGKNYHYLKKLNNKHHFFNKIIPMPHPRYILQYKRKYVQDYIDNMIELLDI